ncbi:MAG: hypothetical protein QXU45_09115 [Candidatus Bathyarchaeia archaeon]
MFVVGAVLLYAWTSGLIGGGVVHGQGGAATLAFTVRFKDGTTQTFETTNIYSGKLSVVPLSLYVGGREIAGIDTDVKVRLNTGGRSVAQWTAKIAQRIEIYKSGQNTPLTSSTGRYEKSGIGWDDGEIKTVLSTPLTSETIESAIRQYSGDGDFYFQVVAQIALNVVADGEEHQLTGSGVGGITITMKGYQAMSMSAIVSVSPLMLTKP